MTRFVFIDGVVGEVMVGNTSSCVRKARLIRFRMGNLKTSEWTGHLEC